ncbi:hypothetical protein ACET3Z_005529 [Daucus carota]
MIEKLCDLVSQGVLLVETSARGGDDEFIRARKGKAIVLQDPNLISSALPSQVAMSLLDSSFNLDALVGGDVALKHAITNAFIGAVADVLLRWSFPMLVKGAGSEFARIDGAGPVSFRLGSGLGVSQENVEDNGASTSEGPCG